MNIFSLFGFPDVHELADRVLSGNVATIRTPASAARIAGQRMEAQADAVARERIELNSSWTGEAADSADAALRSAEDAMRKQAKQLTAGADDLDEAGDALERAQRDARRIDTLASVLDGRFDRILQHIRSVPLAQARAIEVFSSLVLPLRPEAVALVLAMRQVLARYENTLEIIGRRLAAERGVVRLDAGPEDVGDDARSRQAALYRNVYGTDPVSGLDWLMAEALDPRSGDPNGTDLPGRVTVLRIDPVPGAGVVHGGAFIADQSVFGGPESVFPWDDTPGYATHRGDGRSFDPQARPHESRVSFYVDYERGIVIVRQNATHADDGTTAVGDPTVGVEQDPQGRVRLRVEASNPLAPEAADDTGFAVREDVVIDPTGGNNGAASVNGRVSQYPSWEFYQQRPDGSSTTILQRPQNDTGPMGPFQNLPLDTVEVGDDPAELDRWNRRHHPEQTPSELERELQRRLPGTPLGDPWYNNPLPRTPYPRARPDGGVQVPDAAVLN